MSKTSIKLALDWVHDKLKVMDLDIIREYNLRSSTKFIKNHFSGKLLVGAEVGVFRGHNAKSLLTNLNIKKLYLIDPYQELPGYNASQKMLDRCFRDTKKRLSNFPNKVFIRKQSEDAHNELPSLDFIYIDGHHSQEAVKRDIENYYKKINPGGVISGHDIATKEGVTQAVLEFVNENNLKLNIRINDWWVIKPNETK